MNTTSSTVLTIGERRDIVDAITEAAFIEPYGIETRREWYAAFDDLMSRDVTLQYLQVATPYFVAMDQDQRVSVVTAVRDQHIEGPRIVLLCALVADGCRVDAAFAGLPPTPSEAATIVGFIDACPDLPKGALKKAVQADLRPAQIGMVLRLLAGRKADKAAHAIELAQHVGAKHAGALMVSSSDIGTDFMKQVEAHLQIRSGTPTELITTASRMSTGHAELMRLRPIQQAIPRFRQVIAEQLLRVAEIPKGTAAKCADAGFGLEHLTVFAALLGDNPDVDPDGALIAVGALSKDALTCLSLAVTVEDSAPIRPELLAALGATDPRDIGRRAMQALVLMADAVEIDQLETLVEAVARIPVEAHWQYAFDVMRRSGGARRRLAERLVHGLTDEGRPWGMRDLEAFCQDERRVVREREQAFAQRA